MGVLTDSLNTYNIQKGDLEELYGILSIVNKYTKILNYIRDLR